MNRRSFLGMVLAAAAAPAYVRAQSLMPVRAPSSAAAIAGRLIEGHMLDAMRYGLGVLEVTARDGRILAALPVGGSLFNGAKLDVKPGPIHEAGIYEAAFLRTKWGRFRIETLGSGTLLSPGDTVTCAGLDVKMDRASELIAGGVLPGTITAM